MIPLEKEGHSVHISPPIAKRDFRLHLGDQELVVVPVTEGVPGPNVSRELQTVEKRHKYIVALILLESTSTW